MDGCLIVLIVAPILLIIGAIAYNKKKAEAWRSYQDSLERLKRDPNNPDRRQKTLELGRQYATSFKVAKGHTKFDELALMNDINAACAQATVGQNTVAKVVVTNPGAFSGRSVTDEIERLGKLLLAGVITGEEFERGKTLFLGARPGKARAAVDLLHNLDALKKQGVLSPSEFNAKKWEILSERLIQR